MERQDTLAESKGYFRLRRRIIKMRIAICDDEKNVINEIKHIVFNYGKSHRFEIVIDCFSCGEELINSKESYDIIYLDYQMGRINGMQTAYILREKNINCTLIFITAYPDFVYESFAVDPFRFLVKPIDSTKITETLDAYFEKYGNDYPVLLQIDRETIPIETSNIVFLEAMGKHCIIHTKDNQLECAKTMAVIARMMPRDHFFKINKAFIVNFDYISRYNKTVIFFKNDEYAYISRNYYTAFKVAYRRYSLNKRPM